MTLALHADLLDTLRKSARGHLVRWTCARKMSETHQKVADEKIVE